jgi:hypothetical protein
MQIPRTEGANQQVLAQRAAQKIAARLKSVHKKPSLELLAELIARSLIPRQGTGHFFPDINLYLGRDTWEKCT